MNGVCARPRFQFFERLAEVVQNLVVDVFDRSVRRQDRNESGNPVDHLAKSELVLHRTPFWRRPLGAEGDCNLSSHHKSREIRDGTIETYSRCRALDTIGRATRGETARQRTQLFSLGSSW